jgi:ORF6N domain
MGSVTRTTSTPARPLETRIILVRGERVMIDADLAAVYGVPTKALNQAVKRNPRRFPADFAFRLSAAEKSEVVTNCDHLARLRFAAARPYAFTEHGAIMAANVLNSRRAVELSVEVVRAFARLREMVTSHKDLAKRLDELESRYDRQFKAVFDAIRELMRPSEPKTKRKIGFV